MNHKDWLDNEYSEWIKALQESTVHNFKNHPVVKRMLGEAVWSLHASDAGDAFGSKWNLINQINDIGYSQESLDNKMRVDAGELVEHDLIWDRGNLLRYVYYANRVLKRNPTSICEIGGGVGQFYAILRALGYKGEYMILDLEPVHLFQLKYLNEVNRQTGLNTDFELRLNCEMAVSFYALGEFSDEKKKHYFDTVINKMIHGYIAWNPHSGASDDLSLFKHDIKVTIGIEPGIKIIQW